MRGANILWFPYTDPAMIRWPTTLCGIPFLAPWANRLPGSGFWADGRRFILNRALSGMRFEENGIAIHGLLLISPFWRVTELRGDGEAAWVTCRLDFWRYPDLVANWPFAHEYEMTVRLSGGVLEVATAILNRSELPMPVSLGFHPYLNFPGGAPRDEVVARIPARKHVDMDAHLIPTGAMSDNTLPDPIPLASHALDDGFTDLIRGEDGSALFSAEARGRKIEVLFGPKYRAAIAYAPAHKNFICFEPMSAITNGINLAHDGKYPDLQVLPPGEEWRESFRIRTVGFKAGKDWRK